MVTKKTIPSNPLVTIRKSCSASKPPDKRK